MSEETNVADATDEQHDSGENTQENDTKAETFSREYVEELRKESARYRTEAKEAKTRLEALEAGKEEVGSTLEEKAAALETAQIDVLRYKLALKHGLDEEDVELFLTASDEETLEKQAQRISERNSATALRPDPAQGRRTATGTPSNADAFAQALEGQL